MNRSRSPVSSSSHPNPITHSLCTLSILIGVGVFTLGAIAISRINLANDATKHRRTHPESTST
ncbi:hypothetical protein [Coleofasciculus sp. E2-BRE-01]|uniref:hypothetical protein n=1 Tax=Coleofasciculus sp. E2-BRE-01 TaxID=3069524 RepID=UPI0032FD83EF